MGIKLYALDLIAKHKLDGEAWHSVKCFVVLGGQGPVPCMQRMHQHSFSWHRALTTKYIVAAAPCGRACAAAKLQCLCHLSCNADTLYIYDLGKVVRMFR